MRNLNQKNIFRRQYLPIVGIFICVIFTTGNCIAAQGKKNLKPVYEEIRTLNDSLRAKLVLFSYKKIEGLIFSLNDKIRGEVTFSGEKVEGRLQLYWIAPEGGEKFNHWSESILIKPPRQRGWTDHWLVSKTKNPFSISYDLMAAIGEWELEVYWLPGVIKEINNKTLDEISEAKKLFQVKFKRM